MTDIAYNTLNFNAHGLIPAIIQETGTKDVLMMAYMNRESLEKTCKTGETWFWSRSRKCLWNKGATSGNKQKVISISYDCDADTLLILVEQQGKGACHTGEYSCFFQKLFEINEEKNRINPMILQELQSLVLKRKKELPEDSYTATLFQKGLDTILKKIGEESSEVIIAAKSNDTPHTVYELADLLFHLIVLMTEQGIEIEAVYQELQKRFNVGGFQWKEGQKK